MKVRFQHQFGNLVEPLFARLAGPSHRSKPLNIPAPSCRGLIQSVRADPMNQERRLDWWLRLDEENLVISGLAENVVRELKLTTLCVHFHRSKESFFGTFAEILNLVVDFGLDVAFCITVPGRLPLCVRAQLISVEFLCILSNRLNASARP